MNENVGTTKLLTLHHRGKLGESRLGFQSDAIAVRFGAKSSSIALVDTSDDEKVLIFAITYTEASHRSVCVDFIASGEAKDQIKRVFVNQLVPEFTDRLAEFASRAQPINFAAEVSKSANLLPHLADSYENIIYVDAEDCGGIESAAGAGSRAPTAQCVALIDSSGVGSQIGQAVRMELSCVPVVASDNGDDYAMGFGGQNSSIRPLDIEAHKTLVDTRQSLFNFLASDAEMVANLAVDYRGDSTEDALTHLLQNTRVSDKSDNFQTSFAAIVKPALSTYAAVIKENFPLNQDPETDVFVSDCIFNSQFCRRVFLRDYLHLSDTRCKTIRFVKDPGVLGFMGALMSRC